MPHLTTRTNEQIEDHFAGLQQSRLQKIAILEEALKNEEDSAAAARIQKTIDLFRGRIKLTASKWDDWEQAFFSAREYQIATYNEAYRARHDSAPNDPWDELYQCAGELPDGQSDNIISKGMRGKSGRLMRLYSQTNDVAVPRGSSSTFDTEIEACIVDPCLIPDDAAQKLGIVSFEESDTPEQRLLKKMSPACIENLKQIFRESNPISRGNNRTLVINTGPSKGNILYSSEKVNASERGFRLKAGIYDAYGAERKTFHEQGHYLSEMTLLLDVLHDIKNLISRLDKQYRKDTPEEKKRSLKDEALKLSMRWQAHFHACENHLKTDACERLEGMDDLIENNVSAAMSKLVAATNRLMKRLHQEIPDKGSYNWRDQMALMASRKSQEKIMRQFREQVQDDAPLIEGIREPSDVIRLFEELGFPSIDIGPDRITLQPFRFYADCMLKHLHDFNEAVSSAFIDPAKDALLAVHCIGKCQGFHEFLADLQRNIIQPKWVTVTMAQYNLKQIRKYLEAEQIYPGRQIEGFQEIFDEMLGALIKLEEIIEGKDDFESSELFFEELEKFIKQFDMQKRIKSLAHAGV